MREIDHGCVNLRLFAETLEKQCENVRNTLNTRVFSVVFGLEIPVIYKHTLQYDNIFWVSLFLEEELFFYRENAGTLTS